MEVKQILLTLLYKATPWFASKIKKKIYPKKEFEDDIEIDVRSTNPISFSLNSQIPSVSVWFRVINKSQYLNFDASISSIWLKHDKGYQPIIKSSQTIPKEHLSKKESKDIYCSIELKQSQISYLREVMNSKEVLATVNLKANVNSKLYQIKKEVSLENKPCKIEG